MTNPSRKPAAKPRKQKLILTIEVDMAWHVNQDPEELRWFEERVLFNPADDCGLILHSNEIGDEVGSVKVLTINRPAPPSALSGVSAKECRELADTLEMNWVASGRKANNRAASILRALAESMEGGSK